MATAQQILEDMNADAKPVVEKARQEKRKAKQEALAKWLAKNRPHGISFCTNSMLDRGDVVVCRIEGTTAIIEYEYGWWGPQFSQREEHRKGEVLGEIREEYTTNRAADKHLKCGGMNEGRG